MGLRPRISIPGSFPDPKTYRILSYQHIGECLIVEINYPDCLNFEGNKILVYKNINIERLTKMKSIDPHFSNRENCPSPIARFEPTNLGRELAFRFATMLSQS